MDPSLPSVLKITTVHMLGIWWYPFGRESIVVARGPDRRWLAVGHPSLRYARILGHTPALSDDDLKSAAAALAEAQFDLCAMVLTVQTDGRQQPTRVCDIVRPTTLPLAPVQGTLQ
jgi:lipocalin